MVVTWLTMRLRTTKSETSYQLWQHALATVISAPRRAEGDWEMMPPETPTTLPEGLEASKRM